MKSIKLSLLAGASLLAAGSAFAYGPTVTPDYVIYAGGGAEQNAAFEAIARSLFDTTSGTLDSYTEVQTGTVGKVSRAVFGKTKAAFTKGSATVPAGSKVLIYYRSNGGVFGNGVGPVLRAQTLPYLSIAGATLIPGATAGSPSGSNPTYQLPASPTIVNAVPDIGLANEEVGLFQGVNLPAGQTPLSVTELGNVDKAALYQVVNGIGITQNLYSQGKTNFTKAEIAAILAGTIQDWSQISDDTGVALPAGPIILLDRNAGSGAKAAANAYFLNQPAVSAVLPANFAGDQGDPVNYSAYTVQTLSSAGTVATTFDTVQAKGARGIGIIGREYVPGASGQGTNWRFVSIDGASAGATTFDRTQVISGKYDYVFQASLQTRNKLVTIPNGPAVNPDSSAANKARYNQTNTAYGALIDAFKAAAQNPAVTDTVSGILLDPTVVAPGDFGGAYDAFITRGTRGGNSNAPLILQF